MIAWAHGPDSSKRFLFPPVTPLFSASRDGQAVLTQDPEPPSPKYAFIGVRASLELSSLMVLLVSITLLVREAGRKDDRTVAVLVDADPGD